MNSLLIKSAALLSILFWLGCAEKRHPALPDSAISQSMLLPVSEDLRAAKLACASAPDCPENVGYVLSTVPTDGQAGFVFQCTGFLIAPNIIATNSHCLPKDLRSRGADCSTRIGIKFPAVDGRGEDVHVCERVLFASEIADDENDPTYLRKADYAIFSLKTPSNRKVWQISRSGVSDGDELSGFSVNPMSNKELRGQIVKRTCQAIKGTSQLPTDLHAFSDVNLVFGPSCLPMGGNSGSPMVARDGRVVALLHGTAANVPQPKSAAQNEHVSVKTLPPTYLTNIACLPMPEGVSGVEAIPASCSAEAKQALDATAKTEQEKQRKAIFATSIQNEFMTWSRTAPPIFKYMKSVSFTIINVGNLIEVNGSSYAVNPICIKPLDMWPKEYSQSAGTLVTARFKNPIFQPVIQYDQYSRTQLSTDASSGDESELKIEVDRLKNHQQPIGTETAFHSKSAPIRRPSYLPFCNAEQLAQKDEDMLELTIKNETRDTEERR